MFSKDLVWYIIAVVATSLALSMQLASMLTSYVCKTKNGLLPCSILALVFLVCNCYYILKLGKTIKSIEGLEEKAV